MRITPCLTLALLPAALVAQAPAVPDFPALVRAKTPGIEALLSDGHPLEALAQTEALLPPGLPVFDKSTPNAGRKASVNFSGLTTLYLLAAKTAGLAGEWEKALDYCGKADRCAKTNYQNTVEVATPVIATWTQAMDQAKQIVAEQGESIKALQAKEAGRTPAEEAEYQNLVAKNNIYNTTKDSTAKKEAAEFLQKNKDRVPVLEGKVLTSKERKQLADYKVAQDNLVRGPQIVASLQKDIDATKAEIGLCQPKIDAINRNLKEEQDDIAKGVAAVKIKGKPVKETSGPRYEEAKAMFFEGELTNKANFDSRPKKSERLNMLFRLRHNLAGGKAAAKVDEAIERVRMDQDPFPGKKSASGKKAK